ncbi:hypothetical protein THRCLA_07182 [Thraustotheca clavata]|uniref:Beta-hexosaminidase n=1 Tax=Thraustotheca clavata TaxID=74557 RepID=A0A0A7CM22_9STRA|nr:secreted protein [Thraustotheca clavata]OQR96729.1 hypothetical protein THRCLA_07182 [Thraustotheca clavata]
MIWMLVVMMAMAGINGLQVPANAYSCVNHRCVAEPRGLEVKPGAMGLKLCEMTCSGNLWPLPWNVSLAKTAIAVSIDGIQHDAGFTSSLVHAMQHIFDNTLALKATECVLDAINATTLKINATIASFSEELKLETDESYTLELEDGQVLITAATIYGYRHALTTLTQLIEHDDLTHAMYIITSGIIVDNPFYPHRGVSLDTSRQFYSVASIRRLLDGMGATKLNSFHWHLTDSSSFPIEIKSEPRLTSNGAFSSHKVYTQREIRELVAYGKARGVRIIPELDAPAHAGAGWQWGAKAGLGELGVCFQHNPWPEACVEPPCGQLNPFNDHVYDILDMVYGELDYLFESDVFHMGGDEVHLGCWNMSEAVTKHMTNRTSKAFYNVWGMFQEKARALVRQEKIAIWTSDLTKAPYLNKYFDPNSTIVQMWTLSTSSDAKFYTSQGYSVIASYYDAYYLDCGFGNWILKGSDWCHPYHHWSVLYDLNLLHNVPQKHHKLVLGGEVALWSEEADESSMDVKIWPRAAAAAERWWLNPLKSSWKHAIDRIRIHRDRLVDIGIQADAIQPHWCRLNPGECTLL